MILNLFNKNKNTEYTEKEILCNTIENYIELANTNKNTLSDYLCIISLIKIWKSQYKEYVKEFDEYLKIFEKQGLLNIYKQDDIVFTTYQKFGINPKIANEIKRGFIEGCTSRYINFMIAITVCGKPNSSYSRIVLAEIYNWNFSIFNKQAIYYANLCLMDNDKDIRVLELNAKNYEKNKQYDIAITYYKKILKISKNPYYIKKISSVYKRKSGINSALMFLSEEKTKFKFNKAFQNIINEEIKILTNEKNGIVKHDFNGYNNIESFFGKFTNYKLIERKYDQLKLKYKNTFDNHIKRINKISMIMTNGITNENINDFLNTVILDIQEFYKIENFYMELNSFNLTNNYYYSDNYERGYLLPKKSVIFLEKNNLIDEAIKICDVAIENNIIWDNTKSGMIGRKERLLKKYKSKDFNNKLIN